jgi:hypothetical protein
MIGLRGRGRNKNQDRGNFGQKLAYTAPGGAFVSDQCRMCPKSRTPTLLGRSFFYRAARPNPAQESPPPPPWDNDGG